MKETTEDARHRLREEVTAFFFHELAHLILTSLKPLHDPTKEDEVASVIGHERDGDVLLADGVQGTVSPSLEVSEHLGAHVLQPSNPFRLVRCLLHEGSDTPTCR